MNTLKPTFLQIKRSFYLIFPLVAIFLVSLKFPLFSLVLLPYIYFARKSISAKIILLIVFLFALVYLLNYILFSFPIESNYYFCFKKSAGQVYLTNGFNKIAVFSENDIQVGDFVKLESKFYYNKEVDLNQFSKQISGYFYAKYHVYRFSLRYLFYPYYLTKYLSLYPENIRTWLSAFLLPEINIDLESKKLISGLGLTAAISASGLFIAFLISIIKKTLNYFSVSENKQLKILTVFLFWLFLSNPQSSSFKFAFIYLIYLIADRKSLAISKINALSLTGLLAFLFNPFIVFNLSFALTYLISFFAILNKVNFKWQKSILKSKIKSSIYFYLIVFPLTVNFGGKLNLISLFLSSFILLFLTYFYFPLVLILLLFYPVAYIFEYPYRAILALFSQIKFRFLELSFPEFSIYGLLFYYLILIFFIFRQTTFVYLKRTLFILALVLFKIRYLLTPTPLLKTVVENNTTGLILINHTQATLINPGAKTLYTFKKLGLIFQPEIIYTDLFYFEKELLTLNEIQPRKIYFPKLPKIVEANYYFLPTRFQLSSLEINMLYTTKAYEHLSNKGPILEIKYGKVSLLMLNSTSHSKLNLFLTEHKTVRPTHIFAHQKSAATTEYFSNKLNFVKNIADRKTVNIYFLTKNKIYKYSEKFSIPLRCWI